MNCIRCNVNNLSIKDCPSNLENVERGDQTSGGSPSDQEASDIGGFAGLAGCLHKLKGSEKQLGTPLEEDLGNWGHHFFSASVPDAIFQAAAGDEVTFVFTNQVDGKLTPVESTKNPDTPRLEGHKEETHRNKGPFSSECVKMRSFTQSTPFLPPNKDSTKTILPTVGKSTPNWSSKLPRTSKKDVSEPRKLHTSHSQQIPLKRMSAAFDGSDDDFM